ncbi:DUF3499 domain-containing protein [Frankia sp. CNm7]|uniref:DUF3499 domain-containing protein n=1 Tax=Frankia nepalensis TaxID=1836974 RepID=A0A937RHV2_9ACTN|nr:DUF3499 domain-containing protein [Frankia nepalensis]MBL7496884.1 DUF3499 domain-containing protein [Frankia nepalensis]MBL7512084.1 DUF3499 domain-containing protein [Frankia nepalensis]MBL7521850.1 DUF3499 domain-containing protein [Frankia nepalensis]MBL7630457.1 DUF3499 domain-containing protein [Frankia nepalensis]
MKPRRCSRSACSAVAVATLTYAYAESTAVLGPLSPYVEPHSYDLCGPHADRLTVPRGWAVVRIDPEPPRNPATDDLEALADVVREVARPGPLPGEVPGYGAGYGPVPGHGPLPGTTGQEPPRDDPGGRRHLRAVPTS